ncbi:DMT family transporter [Agromyces archimandritae]|uniref:DMT family transporter n=1 Tax=Agromyces archimandritae TaxID=2781962 RepID=A0A975IRD1_9MICO|nr:DMT family transporter [Agromyces archimandritae]QTX05961.1 DMT family transporter [Agromyces archimandritae]
MSKPIGVLRGAGLALASIAFVATWSSGFLSAKLGVAGAPPATVLFWRFALLAVVMSLVAIPFARRHPLRPGPVLRQALIGVLSQFGYVAFVYLAIAHGVSTGVTALVDAVQPLAIATLVGPLLGLAVRPVQWAGLLIAFAGVTVIIVPDLEQTAAPAGAYLAPVGAVASLVAATLLDRRRPAEMPLVVVLAVHMVAAFAASAVLAAATGTIAPPVSPAFWGAVLYIALVPALAGYALYWTMLRRLGITVFNALLFLVVPTTAVGGALLYGEPFTVATALGILCCGVGVAAVALAERRPAASATAPPASFRGSNPARIPR